MTQLITFLHATALGRAIYLLIISMLPVVELRGAIPVAAILDVPWVEAYALCVFGNMLPVPFLILFSKAIFSWLKKGPLKNFVHKLEAKVGEKSKKVEKYSKVGLFLFVMVPLPGTGAWTGSLIAAALDMRLKPALISIFFGVAAAGAIMVAVSYGFIGLF